MADVPDRFSREDFDRLIEREHEQVELKSGAGRRPLQETMVAFTNAEGGRIFIGVSDSRVVQGRRRDQGLDDDIHEAAATAHNVGRIRIAEISVAGTPVVQVQVQARRDEVAATSDGRVLVRHGGHNRAAVGRELRELVMSRSLVRYETTDTELPVSAIDNEIAAELAGQFGWPDSTDVDRLREQGFVTDHATLTVAGALCLTDPGSSLGAAKFLVDIRAYENDEGGSYIRRDVIGGPVQSQVQRATDLIMRDIGTDMVVTRSRRHDLPRLPRRVVRETVANAVAHRAYDVDMSPITIALRPSALTVLSPGGLPDPVTVETLRFANAPRNHTVIAALRRFGLAEDSGQGIDVIEDGMKLELLAEPVFRDSGSSFEVQLPLRGLVSAEERGWLAEFTRTGLIGSPERLLLLSLLRQGSLTNGQARELLTEDSTGTRTRLRKLRDAGLIEQHGTRGRAYYTLGRIGPERSNEAVVLEAAAQAPITNERVRSLTGVDRQTALSLLRRLVSDGQLRQVGERRGTRYVLTPEGEMDSRDA